MITVAACQDLPEGGYLGSKQLGSKSVECRQPEVVPKVSTCGYDPSRCSRRKAYLSEAIAKVASSVSEEYGDLVAVRVLAAKA